MFRRRDRRDQEAPGDEALEDGADAALDELDNDELEDDELEDDASADREDQPEDMSADLESQAVDYLAGNDIWMYGPSAETVLEILDRLEEIGPREARPLADAWLAIPKSDRDRARKAARKLAENDEELTRYLQLAREACGTWMSVTGPFPEFVNADPDWGRLCAQSGEAALDAATAVILEGKLEELHYESLIEPWSEAMAQLDAADDAEKLESSARDEADDDEDDEGDEDAADDEDAGKFGPNSDEVTDFLNRLWLLTPEQVGRLVGGWQNSNRDDLKTAHESLRALALEDSEWRDQVRNAQEELTPWLNAGRIAETSGFLGQTGQGESRKMAGPALADAIAALVLGDILDREQAMTLYGPWFNLVGAPELPSASAEPAATGKAAKSAETAAAPKAAKAKVAGPAAKAAPKAASKSSSQAAAKPKAKGKAPKN